MLDDLDRDEKRAAATPRDWAIDFNFHGGHTLHCCAGCLRTFRSFPVRELCCECDPRGCGNAGNAPTVP